MKKEILKKNDETPRTNRILAIFDPITFPTIASLAGIVFDAAIIVTTNSGAEVPKAIIVRPIRIGGSENFFAIKSALFSMFRELQIPHPLVN